MGSEQSYTHGSVSDLLREGGRMMVSYNGVKIPVDYQKGIGNEAIFLFHGAAKRSKRDIPFFQPFLPNSVGAHQFSLSDPTMLTTEIIESGWYSGAAGDDLQNILRSFFGEIRTRLNCERRVYVGASSGGFAALLYSHADPGSIVVSAIPQTVLRNHYRVPVNRYRHECWLECETIPDLDDKADFDLAALYAQGFENTVVYVQSSGDHFHIANHFSPFLAVMDEAAMEQVVCDLGFWGVLGHSGATPPSAFLPWVEAALTTKEINADALLETRFDLYKTDLRSRIAAAAKKFNGGAKVAAGAPPVQDLKLNTLVRDFLLTES